ncbi:hypothetical protein DFQ04_1551 [Algoriphagus boseongensis]|uniref:Uncharacterized protein n=1 Tax=Algoriphagus boseongensis TaxID=1442587 RepID=A0A4R6T3U0_9BACT|nr:hypothetical protein [Algoriphagus boseongensis]TDQ16903.1 hypothetical protein DFQ04_1551 [Algoriphagus boseongensis]
MMSYSLLKIGELGSYAVLVVFILKYIPEILKSLFLFYQKYLDHKLEWKKQEDVKELSEKEIEQKTILKRKPPS